MDYSDKRAATENFLASVDAHIEPGKNFNTVNYESLILTRPFQSHKLLPRIVNKIFHIPLFVFKRAVMNYLHYRVDNDYRTAQALHKALLMKEAITGDISRLLDQKIYEVMKLNDMIKSEVMAEINKDHSPGDNLIVVKAKWLNPKSKTLKKVNLGSGSHIKKGYINVDHREIEGVDLVCDIRELPLAKGSLEEILAAHVVEHFTEKQASPLLQDWFGLLKKNGVIRIIVPNIQKMAEHHAKGQMTWEQLRHVILGGQDYTSDYHFNMFSEESLKDFIKKVLPQAKIRTIASDRPNGEALELEVEVQKQEND